MNLVFFLAIILFACFFQGVAGFGAALVAAPLALLFVDKFTVVTTLTLIGLVLNAFLFRKIKQPLDLTLLIPLCIASVIGMPFGIWVLQTIPLNAIKIVAGSLAIVSTTLISFPRFSLPRTKFLTALAGFFSGLLQTSIGMSGPPVVILLAGTGRGKNEMRKTFVTLFLWMSIVSLPFFFFSKTLTSQRIMISVFAIPLVLVGAYVGNKTAEKIPHRHFKQLALITVCITGLVSIYSGLQ